MGELGRLIPEGLVELYLAGSVVQVVVTPDHVSNVHRDIVHDDRKIIGREAIRALYDQIVQLLIVKCHGAADKVPNDGLSFVVGKEPYCRGPPLYPGVPRQAFSVVFRRPPAVISLFPADIDSSGCAVTVVALPLFEQPKNPIPAGKGQWP